MKTAWFPPKKPASESSKGFQSPLPRRRVSRIGRTFRVVEGKASRNNRAICRRSFRPHRVPASFSLHRRAHKRASSRQAASSFSALRLLPPRREQGAIEILHFWHISRRGPKF